MFQCFAKIVQNSITDTYIFYCFPSPWNPKEWKSVDLIRANKGEKINSKILTDMKRMMKYVERAGRELGVWEEEANAWTPEKVTRLYETIQ